MSQGPLPQPTTNGATLKIPVYSDLSSAAKNWSDGKFSIADVTAPLDIGLSILNTALDPLGAIVGAAVDYLMNLLINTVKPLGDAVDFLLGNPDAIYQHAQKWQGVSERIAALGNEHAQTAKGAPSWNAPGAEGYRAAQRALNDSYQEAVGAAHSMGQWVTAVGSGVGIFRELMWGMLKDFITEIVKAALIALAAAIPSAGTSIGAFTGWLGVRASMMCAKFSQKLAKLMRWCSKVAKKLGMSGKAFDKAAQSLSKTAVKFSQKARSSVANGATSYQRGLPDGVQGPSTNHTIPTKPDLPGKTPAPDGVKDFNDAYKNAKRNVRDPIDNANNKGTGRDEEPTVQDL